MGIVTERLGFQIGYNLRINAIVFGHFAWGRDALIAALEVSVRPSGDHELHHVDPTSVDSRVKGRQPVCIGGSIYVSSVFYEVVNEVGVAIVHRLKKKFPNVGVLHGCPVLPQQLYGGRVTGDESLHQGQCPIVIYTSKPIDFAPCLDL